MIYVKTTISILIIICTSMFGKSKGYRYKKREIILKDIEKLIKRIRIEINYTEDKIKNVIEKSIVDLDEDIKKHIFTPEKIECLNQKDKKIIAEYIDSMGRKDIESENSLLNQIELEIKIQIEEAQNEKESNMKLYEKLGVLVGIGIVIVII